MKLNLNDILDGFLTSGKDAAQKLGKDSQAIAGAVSTTMQIGERAARDLAAGRIDLTAAERVAQRGFDQLRTAATAEGNLIAASTVDWLEGVFGTILKLIPNLKLG